MNHRKSPPTVNLNLNVRGLSKSATLEINEKSNALIREGREVFKLGLGQSPFPVPESVVAELKANAHQKAYLPVMGLPALCDAVADFHRRMEGIDFTGDDVLIGPGSKELMFILQLVYYGDLLIPSPSWVSYAPQAQIVGRHIRWLQTTWENDLALFPEELDRHCRKDPDRPRLMILNYPNNPSGNSFISGKLKALADVARKYRIILLSDEIYGELNHRGQHVSIARYYPEGTIISSGLSKWCGAGGWRLGTFAFPKSLGWLKEAMGVVASETFTSTSAPIQYAAVRAFQGGLDIEKYLYYSRRILRSLGQYFYQRLRKAGAILPEPRGGFYLFVNFEPFREKLREKGVHNSTDFCNLLLDETGVAILPGVVFGRPAEELSARLAYVDFDGARALVGAAQVPNGKSLDSDFLNLYFPKMIKACDQLCQWLEVC